MNNFQFKNIVRKYEFILQAVEKYEVILQQISSLHMSFYLSFYLSYFLSHFVYSMIDISEIIAMTMTRLKE